MSPEVVASRVPQELQYVLLLFALFVVPKMLQRYRLPGAITSLALGAAAGMGLGLFQDDTTIRLLSTFGIVSLFLFAGLEVELHELRANLRTVLQTVVLWGGAMVLAAVLAIHAFGLSIRPAALVALALLTPSTGFILDSLRSLGLTDRERFWVKTKAVALELVALAVLFVALQSTTLSQLGLASLVLAALVALVPFAFQLFASRILPYAPKSEFAFLMMVAVVAAFVTMNLGVYYLVGAFVVGIVAQRFRERLPAMGSERILDAAEVFASVFVPFYFFNAGLHLRRTDFGFEAFAVGGALLCLVVPARILFVAVQRRLGLGEPLAVSARVALPMLPTLVFTLVIAEILRDRFGVPAFVFGGLIVYTLVNTLIPGFVLHTLPPAFESPHVSGLEARPPDSPEPAPVAVAGPLPSTPR